MPVKRRFSADRTGLLYPKFGMGEREMVTERGLITPHYAYVAGDNVIAGVAGYFITSPSFFGEKKKLFFFLWYLVITEYVQSIKQYIKLHKLLLFTA